VLDAYNHQGHYAEAFVRAIACAAGFVVSKPDPDVGDDLVIASPGPRATLRDPTIYVQIRSWSVPQGTDAYWQYPLKVATFNQLAGSGFSAPHYLVVCIVPTEAMLYANASAETLSLQHAAYWYSLEAHEPDETLINTSTKTVHVPKQNLLTVSTLTHLVERHPELAVVQ
jgi:hypothetical protein